MAKRPIELSPRALRDLQRLSPQAAESILDDMEVLRETPWPAPPKVKKLSGYDLCRLRTGDYRSISEGQGKKVIILRVVDRKEFERILKTL